MCQIAPINSGSMPTSRETPKSYNLHELVINRDAPASDGPIPWAGAITRSACKPWSILIKMDPALSMLLLRQTRSEDAVDRNGQRSSRTNQHVKTAQRVRPRSGGPDDKLRAAKRFKSSHADLFGTLAAVAIDGFLRVPAKERLQCAKVAVGYPSRILVAPDTFEQAANRAVRRDRHRTPPIPGLLLAALRRCSRRPASS
jgi:hypothetical protein